ncbi:MAG: T9SS type A sorting domain-containing protein [Paludibacteraceae bacterium]
MKKLFIIISVVSFMTATAIQAQTLTTKVTKTYTWNTGNASRDFTIYNGKAYVIDNANTSIHVIDGSTGTEDAATIITDASFVSCGITADGAGNLFLTPVSWIGNPNWKLTKVDLLNGNAVTALNNGAAVGSVRTDFIEAFSDGTNTRIAGAVCGGSANNLQIFTVSGATAALTIPSGTMYTEGAYYNDAKWIDATHLLMTSKGQVPYYVTVDYGTSTIAATPIGETAATAAGSAYFKLNDKPYIVLPQGNLGVVKVFDITNPAAPAQVGEPTAAIGTTGLDHIGIEAKVDGNKANIYVWTPNAGLAIHEFTAIQNSVKTIDINSMITVSVKEGKIILKTDEDILSGYTLYNVDGRTLLTGKANDTTVEISTNHLANGVYLLQVSTSKGAAVKKINWYRRLVRCCYFIFNQSLRFA